MRSMFGKLLKIIVTRFLICGQSCNEVNFYKQILSCILKEEMRSVYHILFEKYDLSLKNCTKIIISKVSFHRRQGYQKLPKVSKVLNMY